MTTEQYNRAVQIHNRLSELQQVKKEIENTANHCLRYAYRGSSNWQLTTGWVMQYIAELLDRHDTMIRAEIDEEINNLTKEIETL